MTRPKKYEINLTEEEVKELKRIIRRKVDGRAEARIIELATSKVPEGHANWTLRLLEEECKIILDIPVSKDTIRRT